MRQRIMKLWASVVGGVFVVALVAWFGRRVARARPTGSQLLAMTDPEFASFIRSTGIKTVTTAGMAAPADLAT